MEINEEMIKQLASPYKYKIMIGAVIIAAIFLAVITFTIGRYHPAQSTLDQLLAQQIEDAKEKNKKDMAEKDKLIAELQKQLSSSQEISAKYLKRLNELQKQYKDIKPPANVEEVRKRLKELGYETI